MTGEQLTRAFPAGRVAACTLHPYHPYLAGACRTSVPTYILYIRTYMEGGGGARSGTACAQIIGPAGVALGEGVVCSRAVWTSPCGMWDSSVVV